MPERQTKKATLYDVAESAGVSYQTVSRVINGSPHVSPQTLERVQAAIRKLDYQPNRAARTLASRRSNTLEVVFFGITLYGPTRMLTGVERSARELGYQLIYSNVEDDDPRVVEAAINSLSEHLVDGAIMITPVQDPIFDDLIKVCRDVPFVQLDAPPDAKTPSVVIDQAYGSRLVTQHLIDCEHRHIAEISGPMYWHDAIARHKSWLATLERNGLAAGESIEGDWTAESGYQAARMLLKRNSTFTAIVAGNDQMALGAMRALREQGLNIPGDVSIVGFDDIPEAAYFEPPLTTVRQDFAALGKQSVEYLVEMIREREVAIHQRVLYPTLIERSSTRAI